mgnify:CR=1 FL=1
MPTKEELQRPYFYPIPMDRGGFSYNPNIDTIPIWAMVDNTKNLMLDKGGRRPRGGTTHVTGVSMASRVMGIKQYKASGTNFILRATADGKIYKNDTDTINTGWATSKKVRFEIMNKLIFAANGYDRPKYWDGSAGSMTNLTTLHADWTGTNFPSKFIIHGRGVSRRMWAIGCPSTPYSVYFSKNDDPNDFSVGGGGGVIDVDTGDDVGVLDFIVYGDRLFVGGKNKFYLIDDDDASIANWGYQEAQWDGGTYTDLLIRIPSDTITMDDKGNIYSVIAAQEYGDYSYASLSNPDPHGPFKVPLNENPHITQWIQEFIDLSKIDNFHAVCDKTYECVYFFMTPNGYTTNKLALVYFYNRPPQEAWMIHNNYSYSSGYDASSSVVIEVGIGNYRVYTGDYSGILWKLQTANNNDNGSSYYKGYTTPYISIDNPVLLKKFIDGTVITEPEGDYYISTNTFVDNVMLSSGQVSLSGSGSALGSFVLGESRLAGNRLISDRWKMGSIGKRAKIELYNNSVNEDFFISQILLQIKLLGVKPE